MKKILVGLLLLGAVAVHAEDWIGTIIVTDGGTSSNRTTGYTNSNYGISTKAFSVPAPNGKISIQCDEDAWVCTNRAGCDAGVGVAITAGQLFPTTTVAQSTQSGQSMNPDAGVGQASGFTVTYYGGHVSIAPNNTDAGCTAVCRVYTRSGNE